MEQNLGINRKCSHSKEKKHTVLKHVKMNLTLVIKYFNFPGILARVSKGQKKNYNAYVLELEVFWEGLHGKCWLIAKWLITL